LATGKTIRGFNAQGQAAAFSRKALDELTATAKLFGASGLVWLKVEEGGQLAGSAAKFLTEAEKGALLAALEAKAGDLLLIVADSWRVASEALGRLRLEVGAKAGLIDEKALNFLWVVEFPLLEWDEEEKRYAAVHHPFTSPMEEDVAKLETAPGEVRAIAYDIVLNGIELGGGSIRIHNPERQAQMFKILGISQEQAKLRFGHLLEAFSFGAPPHGGLALGFDRFAMLMCGAKSIREVIAFPKTAKACCLMTDSPSDVDAKQLEELHIRLADEVAENPEP
ncbi:MAG: Asp-tRNA(Asn)/Glu-tRNA(Gln) amidotransferase GatCAB subunit C, partial [Victivallales bacterium]|nr:Asp-tRNA(Asn)/Glu-tRNA(Gln) amidotransferase GatCAB subunit C [Victivallales bacterium]